MKIRQITIVLLAMALAAPISYGVFSGRVSADETGKGESDPSGAIAIDEAHFPDKNFRDLVKTVDTDGNGSLSVKERNDVYFFSCENSKVHSCKGVEYFTNLRAFWCNGNQITELDLSKNKDLLTLDCSQNKLTELDLSHNLNLYSIDCSLNKIQKLDCSNHKDLAMLNCTGTYEVKDGKCVCTGALTTLDVSGCKDLENLSVSGNKLTKLDISDCSKLENLICTGNQLEELDVSHQTKLQQLGCGYNKITSLDVSKAASLNYLEISGSKIESVDLSANKYLSELRCDDSGLKTLDLSGLYKLTILVAHGNQLETLDIGDTKIVDCYDSSKLVDKGSYYEFSYENEEDYQTVNYYLTFDKTTELKSELHNDIVCKIDKETFPDWEFRKYISQKYDLNNDKKLSVMEIGRVEEMTLGYEPTERNIEIKSIKGIENFTSMVSLVVYGTKLEEFAPERMDALKSFMYVGEGYEEDDEPGALKKVDLSNCVNLEFLEIFDCNVESVNISKNKKLDFLSLNSLPIKTLDISKNPALKQVEISYCEQLKTLKINKNDGLMTLTLVDTKISSLDLSQCPNLQGLSCNLCPISNLDLSLVPDLEDLCLVDVPVTQLNLKKLKKLGGLVLERIAIGSVDLSHNPDIQNLYLTECELSSLDISNLSNLMLLRVNGNKLKKLDLSHCPDLEELECNDNQIETLDFSHNPYLRKIGCYSNELKSLDVSKCSVLEYLECSYNYDLTELKLPKNGALISLLCEACKLSSLDLSGISLCELHCGQNPIQELDLSQQKEMIILDVHSMYLTKIDVKHMANLDTLSIADNLISELEVKNKSQLWSLDLRYNMFEKDPGFNAEDYMFEPQKYVGPLEGAHLVSRKQQTISLAWNEAKFAEKYEIYRSNSKDGQYELVGSSTTCAFDDTTTEADKTYYYYVVGLRSLSIFNWDPTDWYGLPSEKFEVGTGEVAPKPTPSEGGTFDEFVERLYTVALNRESDPEGKEFWIKQVVEEGKTGADCARFFLLGAPEFMNRNLSVEDFVETLYKTFFDRESDAAGKQGWVDAINSGKKTRAEVVNDFIESTEWCNVCAAYGVKSGAQWHKATKASKNATNFATRLYTCCLKRDAEEGGLKYWSLALTNLEKTGAEAARFFFESDEFKGYNTTIDEYLNRLYLTFMDRSPAASEIEYWIGEVNAGRQTRHSILAFFAQSPEFTGLCKEYGIERGVIA